MNYFKTFMLMTGMIIFFIFVGYMVGGEQGMFIAFGIAIMMNFFSYWFSDKIVLSIYKAQPVSRSQASELYKSLDKLAKKAKIPVPKLYIINESMPNAFATGRNPQNAVVAVTTGLLDVLDPYEVEAVIAHELSHVKHRDILTGTIAATIAGAITLLSRFGFFFGDRDNAAGSLLMLILGPIAAIVIQMMISRSMEYSADKGAASITGRPQDLINALTKIHAAAKTGKVRTHATPETSHMLIASPFHGGLASLFSTHPSLENRVKNLKKLM